MFSGIGVRNVHERIQLDLWGTVMGCQSLVNWVKGRRFGFHFQFQLELKIVIKSKNNPNE